MTDVAIEAEHNRLATVTFNGHALGTMTVDKCAVILKDDAEYCDSLVTDPHRNKERNHEGEVARKKQARLSEEV